MLEFGGVTTCLDQVRPSPGAPPRNLKLWDTHTAGKRETGKHINKNQSSELCQTVSDRKRERERKQSKEWKGRKGQAMKRKEREGHEFIIFPFCVRFVSLLLRLPSFMFVVLAHSF